MTILFAGTGNVRRRLTTAVVAVWCGIVACFGAVSVAGAAPQNVEISLYERILTPSGQRDTMGAHKVQAGGSVSWDATVSMPGPMFATLRVSIPTGLNLVNVPSECSWESPNVTLFCQLTALSSTVQFSAQVSDSLVLGTILKTTFEISNQVSTKSISTTLIVASTQSPTQPAPPPPVPPTTPVDTPPSPEPPPSNSPGNTPVIVSPPSATDDAALSLNMTGHLGSGASGKVGDPVIFDFKILNAGQGALNSLTLSTGLTEASAFSLDECIDQGGSVIPLESVVLSPDEFVTCTGSSVVTQADLDAGEKVISPTVVEAHVVDVDTTVRASASGAVRLGQNPQLKLVPTSSMSGTAVGDVLNITLTATNIGNVTLQSVAIDASPVSEAEASAPTLPRGESVSLEFPYTLTAADVAAGKIRIEAIVTGQTLLCPNETCGPGQTVSAIVDSDLSLVLVDPEKDDGSDDASGFPAPIWLVIYGLIAVGIIAVGAVIIRSRRATHLAEVSSND